MKPQTFSLQKFALSAILIVFFISFVAAQRPSPTKEPPRIGITAPKIDSKPAAPTGTTKAIKETERRSGSLYEPNTIPNKNNDNKGYSREKPQSYYPSFPKNNQRDNNYGKEDKGNGYGGNYGGQTKKKKDREETTDFGSSTRSISDDQESTTPGQEIPDRPMTEDEKRALLFVFKIIGVLIIIISIILILFLIWKKIILPIYDFLSEKAGKAISSFRKGKEPSPVEQSPAVTADVLLNRENPGKIQFWLRLEEMFKSKVGGRISLSGFATMMIESKSKQIVNNEIGYVVTQIISHITQKAALIMHIQLHDESTGYRWIMVQCAKESEDVDIFAFEENGEGYTREELVEAGAHHLFLNYNGGQPGNLHTCRYADTVAMEGVTYHGFYKAHIATRAMVYPPLPYGQQMHVYTCVYGPPSDFDQQSGKSTHLLIVEIEEVGKVELGSVHLFYGEQLRTEDIQVGDIE